MKALSQFVLFVVVGSLVGTAIGIVLSLFVKVIQ
jgi:hypothetical protein